MSFDPRGTIRWARCFVLLLAGCLHESPPPETFAGTYSLGATELRLDQVDAERYRGTWRSSGAEYPLEARPAGKAGELLLGWVEFPSGRASLAASLSGETLHVSIELLSYRLSRCESAPPRRVAERIDTAPQPALPVRLATVDAKDLVETVEAAAAEAASDGERPRSAPLLVTGRSVDGADLSQFRQQLFERAARAEHGPPFDSAGTHPAGFHFSFPSSWKLQTLQEGTLSLTPPDVRMATGGPAEMFLFLGEPTGLRDPAEPAARELVTRFVADALPFVESDGEPVTRRFGDRPAAIYSWSARERGDLTHRVWLWTSIEAGALAGLLAVLPSDLVASRYAIAEDVFATFGPSPPRGDRRLQGHWMREVVYNAGGLSMLLERRLVLEETGRCYRGGRELDPRNDAGVDAAGTWRASGGELELEWSDGASESWSYSLLGDDLLCRGEPRPRLWRRARPPAASGE